MFIGAVDPDHHFPYLAEVVASCLACLLPCPAEAAPVEALVFWAAPFFSAHPV